MVLVDHGIDLHEVTDPVRRLSIDELQKCASIGFVDALIGIQGDNPLRLELCRRPEKPVAVLRIVPAPVAVAPRVGEVDLDQRFCCQERARVVDASVVQGNDGIGEPTDRLEPARQLVAAVPCGEQADDPGARRAVQRRF